MYMYFVLVIYISMELNVSYDGVPLGAEYVAEIRQTVVHEVLSYKTGDRETEIQSKQPVVKLELFNQNDFHEMVVDIFSYTTWLVTYDVKICPPNLMAIAEVEVEEEEEEEEVEPAPEEEGAVGGRRQLCHSPVGDSGILYPLPSYCPFAQNAKQTCQTEWKLEIEPQLEITYCRIYQEILIIRNWPIASQLEIPIAGVTSIKSACRITPGRLGLGLHPFQNLFLHSLTNQLRLSMPMFGLVINDQSNGVLILGGRFSSYSTKTTRFRKTLVSHEPVGMIRKKDLTTGKFQKELLYGWMIKSPKITIDFGEYYANLTSFDVVFKSTLPGIYLTEKDFNYFRKHVNHTSRDCNYWEKAKPRLKIELIYPIGYISTLLKENILTVSLYEKVINEETKVECLSVVPERPTYLKHLEGKTVIGLPIFKQYYVEFYFNENANFDYNKRMKFAKIK